jgi:threonine dehydrogenase-like Zn-dependent dehydrogenase
MPENHSSALTRYKEGALPLPHHYQRWHLYGAGIENVGKEGQPETVPLPTPGPNELLVRHDACGICFSDIKIINLGGNHPRLAGRNLQTDPVVMGHEVALTIVAVGENLKHEFSVGARYIVQADIYYKGVNIAYGYAIAGGMSQFGLVGPEVLHGDEGNYLLPIADATGYVEAALVEPWACVEAAYHWKHRTLPTEHGNFLVAIAMQKNGGWSAAPEVLVWEKGQPMPSPANGKGFDDIGFVGTPSPEDFENACSQLEKGGRVELRFDTPLVRPVNIDIGRVHYDGHMYVSSKENHRSELKAGGVAWFVGTAGPMGMMHVQRALSLPHPPRLLVGTDRNDGRIAVLLERFGPIAQERGVTLRVFNVRDSGLPDLKALAPDGFDDIVVMVPSVAAIEESFPYLAQEGIMNVFAGVARGTMATLPIDDVVFKNVRIVGTSGSSIADMRMVRNKLESGQLDTGASLAAVGGLAAFRDGLQAVQGSRFPGKTVIFPQIPDLPLTALPDLKTVRPEVYARLKDGKFWTHEAEDELLKESME